MLIYFPGSRDTVPKFKVILWVRNLSVVSVHSSKVCQICLRSSFGSPFAVVHRSTLVKLLVIRRTRGVILNTTLPVRVTVKLQILQIHNYCFSTHCYLVCSLVEHLFLQTQLILPYQQTEVHACMGLWSFRSSSTCSFSPRWPFWHHFCFLFCLFLPAHGP